MERETHVYMAKLAEQAERYDGNLNLYNTRFFFVFLINEFFFFKKKSLYFPREAFSFNVCPFSRFSEICNILILMEQKWLRA